MKSGYIIGYRETWGTFVWEHHIYDNKQMAHKRRLSLQDMGLTNVFIKKIKDRI